MVAVATLFWLSYFESLIVTIERMLWLLRQKQLHIRKRVHNVLEEYLVADSSDEGKFFRFRLTLRIRYMALSFGKLRPL